MSDNENPEQLVPVNFRIKRKHKRALESLYQRTGVRQSTLIREFLDKLEQSETKR